MLKEYEEDLQFPLSFYKNPNDYDKLNEVIDNDNLNPKFKKLNKLLSEFVVDYNLVAFNVLDVKNQRNLNTISALIDKANGYLYSNVGKLKDEKFIEMRDTIAKNDMQYDDSDDEEYN